MKASLKSTLLLFFIPLSLLSKNQQPPKNSIKHIIWDAGSTLTTVSRWNIAHEMGSKTVAGMLWHIGKPYTIRKTMFKLLEDYAGKQVAPTPDDLLSYDENNVPLPHFMSDTWLCSRIPNKQLLKEIRQAVDQWKPQKPITKSQRRILKTMLLTALSADILGEHTCCAPHALTLVKQCADKGYNQYILSNFEREAFNAAYRSEVNQELFSYFTRESILISGDCGMIKPYKCIYTYFLEKYQLNPEECLLIDDRPENVKGARACGMYALRLKVGKYKQLEAKLKTWNIL